jgi:hypothetical protein
MALLCLEHLEDDANTTVTICDGEKAYLHVNY